MLIHNVYYENVWLKRKVELFTSWWKIHKFIIMKSTLFEVLCVPLKCFAMLSDMKCCFVYAIKKFPFNINEMRVIHV